MLEVVGQIGQASEHFVDVDSRAIDDASRSLRINAAGLIHPKNRATMSHIVGMYGPPQSCKRKTENNSLVCANVFGLWWSQRLRAMMDSARSLPY